ncbi:hypothetical protein UFOVP998_9 [uncultured Caudovirales phage]|uniref:Uncharacterized protein n=1 Tax=uncultured Caudovirales phage TaxID=2100421 RepID=A0A6J5SGI7_9CAUD|nr:hypothetical protein UFOVP998_9 [uncultured Caudovirales phage]CAB4199469.1 hypothetical protein UFOVP1331_50 [uncultured Caudovirales phage]CAB4212781.1 hypothetical protein UFOVP1442_25 [uncultured Caudovirales phage]CAB5228027.1 hypothetical protein UFOVP1535_26 [uncultured Caudovirales phage]
MAIAFDASAVTARSDVSASLTFSHTCTGVNRILFVHILGDGLTDGITGVTYAGVAMTLVNKLQMPGGSARWSYLYYLIAPATGANNVIISASGVQSIAGASASYTGAKQTGQPDASNTASSGSANALTASVTTVANQSWTVYGTLNDQGAATMGAGATQRQSSIYGQALSDSNAAITPAGSTSQTHNKTGAAWVGLIASFAPAPADGGRMFAVFP